MKETENKQKHLPVIGVGPLIVIPQLVVTVLAIILSEMGIIYSLQIKELKISFIIIGIMLILLEFAGGVILSILLLVAQQISASGSAVEHLLAKERVAGSIPVSRSFILIHTQDSILIFFCPQKRLVIKFKHFYY